jgi:hypothetical protein
MHSLKVLGKDRHKLPQNDPMHIYPEFYNSFLGPSQPSSFRLQAAGGKENQDRIAKLPSALLYPLNLQS